MSLNIDGATIFQLFNHPDSANSSIGNGKEWGLRLDGLATNNADDVYTFDFEDARSNMRLVIEGKTIRIVGQVYGGLVHGASYEPGQVGVWDVDFIYYNVEQLAGDDDLVVDEGNAGQSTGTITPLFDATGSAAGLFSAGDAFSMEDFAGFGNSTKPFTFQLGDKADDTGIRGFEGISGTGWFTQDGENLKASDWLFTAKPDFQNAQIGDRVWLDADGDGIQDRGEAGVAGVEVTLIGAGTDGKFGTADDTIQTKTTNSKGKYAFKNLLGGNYRINVDAPDGLSFTTQNAGSKGGKDSDVDANGASDVIRLAPGERNRKVDAGLVEDTPANSDPNARNDSDSTPLNTPVNIDVLGNDSDPENDPLSVTSVEGQAIAPGQSIVTNNGSVRLLNNGELRFTPNTGFVGNEVFSYHVSDGNGGEDTAVVRVAVTPPVNTAPTAVNDSDSTELNTPVNINVLRNDSDPENDPLDITEVSDPINGSARIVNGQIQYTPDTGFTGNDVFTYDISDGNGGTDTAQVRVTVTPPANTDPNAVNDSKTTEFNTPVSINVLGNDSDPEGDDLTVTSIAGQAVNPGDTIDVNNGTATLLDNGQISFTPNSGFTGIETFSYHVSDGNGGEDTAQVRVEVTPQPKGTIVGSDSIRERSTETYKIQLDQAVTEDTFITVRIKDGTAQQTDESTVFEYVIPDSYFNQANNYFNPVPEYTRNFFNSGFSQGDTIQWYAPNQQALDYVRTYWDEDDGYDTPANSHTPANSSGVYKGVDALVNDFRVFNPSGDIVTGDTFTVKVAAGSNMSEEFEVLANHEINLGETVIGFFDTEDTETFSLHIESIGGTAATGDLEIDILDKKANVSPIAFDLNGDGIQTLSINEGVKFDLLNTGSAINTGWLSGEDGFLAVDSDGDGLISSRAELFGGAVGEGFAKLASFDSNGDGLVNASDANFGELKLWQDANENGVTDQGELVSLASAGITDLSTAYTNVFSTDANGNIHGEVSSAVKNGSAIEMTDVYFQVEG